MDIFNIIAYAFLSILIIIQFFYGIGKDKRYSDLMEKYMQSEIDKSVYIKKITELSEEMGRKEIEQTDGFVNFLSQSRAWAFDYIEKVQFSIKKFDKEMKAIIAFNETYASNETDKVQYELIKLIEKAFKELQETLPVEETTPDN